MNPINVEKAKKELARAMANLFGNKLSEVIFIGSYARNQQDEESILIFLVLVKEDSIKFKILFP